MTNEQRLKWDYRVFREANGDYVIREVYYDDDGSVIACTENAAEPSGQSLKELAKDIEGFQQALEMPVMTLSEIPQPTKKKRKKDTTQNISQKELVAQLGLAKTARTPKRTPRPNGHTRALAGKKIT